MDPNSKSLRVHISFCKLIDKFIKDFNKKHGVLLSPKEATMIITNKIESAGGLVVD